MNILISIDKNEPPRDLVEGLQRAGHLVSSATAAQAALDAISRDPPDIAIVSYDAAGDHFSPILQAVVGADDLCRSISP